MKQQSSALQWYHRNRDRQLVCMKLYRDTHKEQIRNTQRQYQHAHKARLNKLRNDYDHKKPEIRLIAAAKAASKKRGIAFDLVRSDIAIPVTCPVLGIAIRKVRGPRTDNSPSLDRIMPERGYVRGNVIVISWRANRLKQDASVDELRKLADFYQRIAAKD